MVLPHEQDDQPPPMDEPGRAIPAAVFIDSSVPTHSSTPSTPTFFTNFITAVVASI